MILAPLLGRIEPCCKRRELNHLLITKYTANSILDILVPSVCREFVILHELIKRLGLIIGRNAPNLMCHPTR
jgi:hypothetical protein